MPLQGEKRGAIYYSSESNSEIESNINKNMRGRKNIKRFRILSSSDSDDSDVPRIHLIFWIFWMIWSRENLKPQIHVSAQSIGETE